MPIPPTVPREALPAKRIEKHFFRNSKFEFRRSDKWQSCASDARPEILRPANWNGIHVEINPGFRVEGSPIGIAYFCTTWLGAVVHEVLSFRSDGSAGSVPMETRASWSCGNRAGTVARAHFKRIRRWWYWSQIDIRPKQLTWIFQQYFPRFLHRSIDSANTSTP